MGKFVQFITGHGVIGITLAPFGIYIREQYLSVKSVTNHESTHWPQQLEMLIIPFYIWYFLEWLIKSLISGTSAYRDISFEQEAYAHDMDDEYNKNRKHYAWLKYVFKFEENETYN